MNIPPAVRKLLRRADIDRTVAYGVLSAVRALLIGPITILLVIKYFSQDVQGYYYTFGSFLGLTIFFELGLAQVIAQFASHEWAHLRLDESGCIVGDGESLSRLISLGRLTVAWYIGAAAVMLIVLIASGYEFFSSSHNPGVHWVWPWAVLCCAASLRFAAVPLWSLLEGCNQLVSLYRFRFADGILTSVVTWIAIILGAKLWALGIGTAASALFGLVYLYRRHGHFFKVFGGPPSGAVIAWRQELWPMQWRIALSSLSGYFQFYLFTPIAFRQHGPVLAGQMGMTLALISTLSSVTLMWTQAKSPQFGVFIARKQYDKLDRLFYRIMSRSLLVVALGATLMLAGVLWVNAVGYHFAQRLLPPLPMALFLIASVILAAASPLGIYLRYHKREPLLGISVAIAVASAPLLWFFGEWFGAVGMAAVYLALMAIGMPICLVIWFRFRKEFHHDQVDYAAEEVSCG